MKLAILGLKGHENVVLNGARELKDVELVAVADDHPQNLAKFMASEPLAKGAQSYADWRHLIEHAMFDVACVCDENGVRPEQLLALCKRGVHIVTEKPLATSLAGLEQVRTAIAESRGQLTMLLTMRHEPKYVTLRKLVSEGVIGQVSQVSAQKSYRLGERPEWQKSRATLGGTIPFIGIHALDLMRWTTGLDYTHVAAFHGRIGHPELKELETHATLALQMAGGASVSCRLDYLRPEPAPTHGDDRLRIAGDAGVVEALGFEGDIRVLPAKGEPYRVAPAPTANLFTEFVQSVRAGKPSRITADDACYITEVVLHARQAADDRKLVELPARRPIAAAKP